MSASARAGGRHDLERAVKRDQDAALTVVPPRADNLPRRVEFTERPDDGGRRWSQAIAIIMAAGRREPAA